MDEFVFGKVGPAAAADGADMRLRQDKLAGLLTSNLMGFYAEAAQRGTKMLASNAVAGVDHGASLTTTPPMFLWNPINSGRMLAIMRVGMFYVSGTLGAGFVAGAVLKAQPSAPTTGTELTPVCANTSMPAGMGRVFTGSTITAAATLVRGLFNVGPVLATSAVAPPTATECNLDGSIILAPGTGFAVQGICGAAGTTPRVVFSIEWDELPL